MSQSSPTQEDFHIEIKPLHIIPSIELFYPDLTYATSEPAREIDLLLLSKVILSRKSKRSKSNKDKEEKWESCTIIPVEKISDVSENIRFAIDSSLMFISSIRIFTKEYKNTKNVKKRSFIKEFLAPSRIDIVDPLRIFPNEQDLIKNFEPLWNVSYEPLQFIMYAYIALRRQLASKMLSELKHSLSLALKETTSIERSIAYRYYANLSNIIKNIIFSGMCCDLASCLHKYIDELKNQTSSSRSTSSSISGNVDVVFLPQLSQYIIKDAARDKAKEYAEFLNEVLNSRFNNASHINLYILFIYSGERNNFILSSEKFLNNVERKLKNKISNSPHFKNKIDIIFKSIKVEEDKDTNTFTSAELKQFVSSINNVYLLIYNDYNKRFFTNAILKNVNKDKLIKILFYPEYIFIKKENNMFICKLYKHISKNMYDKNFLEINGDEINYNNIGDRA